MIDENKQKQINYDINNINVSDEYLSDPLFLTLAWKKVHQYIRTTSWYADNFELDKSALCLFDNVKKWSDCLKSNDKAQLLELELIPAPKRIKWHFNDKNEWCPVSEHDTTTPGMQNEEKNLRYLAHIGIKEQTYFTAVMMGLANEVESAQGNPSTPYEECHEHSIVSYGNRLFCNYDNKRAEYNYGATYSYSKYYSDYQRFLKRPFYFAERERSELSPDEDIYLIELDIAKFFDCIDRETLNKKIEILAKKQYNPPQNIFIFKKLLAAFKDWEWTNRSFQALKSLSDKPQPVLPKGIPQGLVAGGFFANIYLLDFDSQLAEKTGNFIIKDEEHNIVIKLIDYCRYVDDIRLVITAPRLNDELTKHNLKDLITQFIQNLLDNEKLNLNDNKTTLTPYRGKSNGISTQLNSLQSRDSGPNSIEDVFEQLNELELLLCQSLYNPSKQDIKNPNPLANIEREIFDVREDTLRRFAANKISKKLSEIRHFTSRSVDNDGKPIPGDWDYLQERLARKFIAVWSHEPSLTLLLKKGLELFPDTRLLYPILSQFNHVITRGIPEQTALVNYLSAELFRHSATYIHKKNPQASPAHAGIDNYFAGLQEFAVNVIKCKTAPDFLKDQASFLLLIRLDTRLDEKSHTPSHDIIFKLINGHRDIIEVDNTNTENLATYILLANQLKPHNEALLRAVCSILENIQSSIDSEKSFIKLLEFNKKLEQLLLLVAKQNIIFLEKLIKYAFTLNNKWCKNPRTTVIINAFYLNVSPSKKPLGKINEINPLSIAQLIKREDNPFANEVMAIKLMLALLAKTNEVTSYGDKLIDLANTKITFNSYNSPPKYEDFGKKLNIVKISPLNYNLDLSSHFETGDSDQKTLQRIAFVIRSALSGNVDFTGFHKDNTTETTIGYHGINTSSQKRQIGLYTTPNALAGRGAQITGWLTTLIAKLLKWPGVRTHQQGYNWPQQLTIQNVKKILDDRLEILKNYYCQLSEMPLLPELITPTWPDDKQNLIVSMVQSKFPTAESFIGDSLLNSNQTRSKHRAHIAQVAALTLKHIETIHTNECNNRNKTYDVDLIVWPELAVHEEDLDILVQLSQKTHAIIFAGLSFINQPAVKGPNNCAIWIVPRKHNTSGNELIRYQGKKNMTPEEKKLGIKSWRPYQLMLELRHPKFKNAEGFMLSGTICYDATDIKLSTDLSNKSNALLISALNKDVNTFDTMVEALHYHMYQHIILVNSGEYGGSYAMGPYKNHYDRLITHTRGKNQVSISTFEMNMFDFRRDRVGNSKGLTSDLEKKTPPAGH